FSWPSLLLFSSQDSSGGTFKTSPRTTFRASCGGHPYPLASSLFWAIHNSAASMSESCAAVMPGMRPPPASCLTRASSVDDTVLTQVSPRRTLEVNFWDFSSSAMSTPDQPVLRSGPKHSAANDIWPELSLGQQTRATVVSGVSD